MTPSRTSRTLLAVLPDSDTLALTLEQAASHHLSVVTAPDPRAALAMVEMALPDIVITDLFLPERTGHLLMEAIRNRWASTVMIASADTADASTILEAMRAGGTDFVPQPTCAAELGLALERAIQRLPCSVEAISGIEQLDYRLTIGTDPHQVEACVSWLIEQTAGKLPESQRLHLRATLIELIVNAVEHGSLEIQCHEKQQALSTDRFEALIEARRRDPRFITRRVVVHASYDLNRRRLHYAIADEGHGFTWNRILTQGKHPSDNCDANGRGVLLAKAFFPDLTYNERGTKVMFSVPLP
ncbi:MAG: response regulator [Nitrospira sp.]|nr:response regulator [Nitrospira sp.]